jgi:2-amino-4-hydroxy-6-hydroxymethyldihydropteridine diphosphokinase
MKVILGLGGNIGDMNAHLDAAIAALDHLPRTKVLAESKRYRTTPVGYLDQPDFLNSVVELETALSPQAVLGACLGIEATVGRVRTFQNAPRVLDVDVLLCEGYESDSEELTVPHPRMRERAFVLVPLADLYPDGIVYGYDLREAMATHREL